MGYLCSCMDDAVFQKYEYEGTTLFLVLSETDFASTTVFRPIYEAFHTFSH